MPWGMKKALAALECPKLVLNVAIHIESICKFYNFQGLCCKYVNIGVSFK